MARKRTEPKSSDSAQLEPGMAPAPDQTKLNAIAGEQQAARHAVPQRLADIDEFFHPVIALIMRHELIETGQVSDASYKAMVDKFGERGAIDLIGVMGYYSLVSMVLNVDRVPIPEGGKLPLASLK